MRRFRREQVQSVKERGNFAGTEKASQGEEESEVGWMSIDEMISKLDGACGRLLVAAMKDPVVREAMEMVTAVSIALGEMGEESEGK